MCAVDGRFFSETRCFFRKQVSEKNGQVFSGGIGTEILQTQDHGGMRTSSCKTSAKDYNQCDASVLIWAISGVFLLDFHV